MANAKIQDMTADEFLIWNLSQDQRFELVDGVPVPLRAMTGASNFHDDIVTNLIAALKEKLRGSGCKPRTADTALRTGIKRVRRPDVTVDCAESRPNSYESNKPVAAFEVLSPSTRKTDSGLKLTEYQHHPTLQTIVHIDPDRMDVAVFRRDEIGDWSGENFTNPSDQVQIIGAPAALTLAEIYDGISFG
jgi:Uma2 family endonuclease